MGEEIIVEQVAEHINLFFFASILALILGFIAWKKGFFNISPFVTVPVKGRDVLRGFFYFLTMQLFIVPIVVIVIVGFIHEGRTDIFSLSLKEQGWSHILAIVGGLSAVLLAFYQIPKLLRKQIWGDSCRRYKDFLLGASIWFVSYPLVLAIDQILSIFILFVFQTPSVDQVAVSHFKNIVDDPWLLSLTGIGIVAWVPITEEILFRGLLQSWFKEITKNRLKAIVLTSMIFSFFHFSSAQGTTNIELIISLFILSCFLGFLYERQRSLWASIGLHSFFNTMSILMILKD